MKTNDKTYCIEADTHCHTVASSHAYGTIGEIALEAERKGLCMAAMTDHGPRMPDGAHEWHFHNSKVLPGKIRGVTILRGAEVNIMDKEGTVDLNDTILNDLDWVIASFHYWTFKPSGVSDHTDALLNVIGKRHIDLLGHLDAPIFPFDIDTVVRACAAGGKFIEINNSSFFVRKGGDKVRNDIIESCKRYAAGVVVNSDAHSPWDAGNVSEAMKLLEKMEFPPELIFNRRAENIAGHIKKHHGRDVLVR